MNAADAEIWEATGRHFDEIGRLVSIPPWPGRVRAGRVTVLPHPGDRHQERSGIGTTRRAVVFVAVVLAIGLVGVDIANRPSGRAGPTGASTEPPATEALPSPAPSVSAESSAAAAGPGCGPSHLAPLLDEGFTPYEGRFGYNDPRLGVGRTIVASLADADVTSYRPILPTSTYPGTVLAAILVNRSTEQIAAVYYAHAISYVSRPLYPDSTLSEVAREGAILLTQDRDDGSRNASIVLASVPRNRWPVEVGPYPAALVWGDPVATGVRPFGLFWADGRRWWSMTGVAVPDDLIDLARSIYC